MAIPMAIKMEPTAILSVFSEARLATLLKSTPEAMAALLRHPWPGNARELENVVERAVTLTTDGQIADTTLLLGLGIRELSMAPIKIARVKSRVRSIDLAAAAVHLFAVLFRKAVSPSEILSFLLFVGALILWR